MTPTAVLDKLLPRWRSKLPLRFSPEFIDGFITRNRGALEAVVARAMMLRGVKRGASPGTPEAFVAYGRLVERERPKDADVDKAVLHRLQARLEKMKGRARVEPQAALLVYVEARAEAMLLRQAGWDAVPLLLREPAIAVLLGNAVVGVVDVVGALHVAAGFDRAEQLRSDIEAAHAKVEALARELGESRFERFALGLWTRVRGTLQPETPRVTPSLSDMPPDAQTKAWRTEANLQAMRLVLSKEPGELTAEDLQVIAQYSGWGGLSIESVKAMLPADLVPESFGLIHEYYTPTVIAESIAELLCPLLPELAGNDGIVRALEPSAGIGRLLRAFSPRRCLALEVGGQIKKIAWTAVEFSKVSSTLLRALRPDVDLFHMPMERWIREEGPRFQGTISFVVANPPYGERGVMAREDPDPTYKEKRAYAYFMRRALDLLVPGGVGAFLIPAGFMSGNLSRELREKLLRRHHLLGAYRIPSHNRKGRETVPGASVVMDLVIWRSRGGELTDIDPADEFIADGDYFKTFPAHILGKEDGSFSGDDEAGTARSWRYQVTGDFRGFPPLAPRPVCTSCVLTTIATSSAGTFQTVTAGSDSASASVTDELRPAIELGQRVGRYLVAVGADEADKAAQLWPELHAALVDFSASFGNPWSSKPLRALAEGSKLPAAQKILGAFEKTGAIVAALREEPHIESRFSGQPDDVVAQAEAIFRQQRALTLPQLMAFHAHQGGTLDRGATLAALFAAEWNLDGDRWDQLYPADAYTSGNDLWARHDRAQARAQQGDEQAKVQVRRLLDAIRPALFDDLTDLSPQHGYVPLPLVAGWLSATLNAQYGAVELERDGGFVQIRGHAYTGEERPPMAPETLAFLGFYNHDPELFKPPQDKRDRDAGPMTREERAAKKQSLADRRIALAKKWSDSFRAWVAADDGRREQLVHAYNRVARGRVVPTYSPEPLDIVRWGAQSPKLKAHQIAGARRVLAQRGGLVAFDVGVGKTYTALAIIARARQEGWVRRPVILVPGSLVWKWHDDILCTLPDYRVAVIGSKRKKISRGVRKNVITSETDTPQERAKKWTMLQTGQLDVVVLSYDALARTKMNEDAVMSYVEQVEAVSRSIALRKRGLEEQAQTAKQREKLSERERALLEHGVRAWVGSAPAVLPLAGAWSPTGEAGVMGTTEDWGKLIRTVAAAIVEVAERRADSKGSAVCSLCRDLSLSLFPVSRGHLCPTCIAVAHLELVKDWRKLKEENEQLRALFREIESTGISLTQVVEVMNNVAADLGSQTAENERLRHALSAAESECLAAREANALLSEQIKSAQREAESLHKELEAVRAEGAECAAERAPAVLAEFKSLLHPRIFDHILDLASSSASSPMAGSIEAFLKGLTLAALQRLEAPHGSSQQVIDTLQKAGYLHPDGHSGRVLSWLVRRTPLVSRTVGNPVVYVVHLDWFVRPPPECLGHLHLRPRGGTRGLYAQDAS